MAETGLLFPPCLTTLVKAVFDHISHGGSSSVP